MIRNRVLLVIVFFLGFACNQYSLAQQNENRPDFSLDTLTAAEKDWLKEHPVIKVTNYTEWPPLDFFFNGSPTGFSIDYLNLVAEKIGISIEYQSSDSWPDLVERLRNKEIDMAHSLIRTNERDQFLKFTDVYLDMPIYYFGRSGAGRIEKIEDLQGRKIGILGGVASGNILRARYKHLDIYELDNAQEAFKALSEGRIDVFGVVLPVANYIISKNMLSGIDVIGKNVLPEFDDGNKIRFAVRDDWRILAGILEKGMSAVNDKEFRQLSTKWQAEYGQNFGLELSAAEKDWLSKNKIIRVAADPTFAPFEYVDEFNQIKGISGAYLNEVAKRLNISFVWAGITSFDEGDVMIKNEQADMFSAIVRTAQRDKDFIFNDPHITLSNVIFGKEDSELFGGIEGLYGRTIAQIEGASLTEQLKHDHPQINIIELKNVPDALRAVSSGQAAAFIGNIIIGSNYIAEEGIAGVSVVGDTLYTTELSMAIRPDLVHLSTAIKKAMDNISISEKADISSKWTLIQFEEKQNYSLLIKIMILVALIILVVLFWLFRLRSEIKQRKIIESELIEARNEAQIANEAKSAFMANLNHEIKMPLDSIIGFSEVMSSGVLGEVKQDKYKEYLSNIKESGESLGVLLDDILDIAKIEAGNWKLEEEKFDLISSVEDVIENLKPKADKKQISLIFDKSKMTDDVEIFADRNTVKRILFNLINNSIKFTNAEGKVICRPSVRQNGEIQLEIIDNGIGIASDKLDDVIKPFNQVHDAKTANELGTGLGLSIVKAFAEMHGGSFILSSKIDVGTRGQVIFPKVRNCNFAKSA